jgi:hypothetical protein
MGGSISQLLWRKVEHSSDFAWADFDIHLPLQVDPRVRISESPHLVGFRPRNRDNDHIVRFHSARTLAADKMDLLQTPTWRNLCDS